MRDGKPVPYNVVCDYLVKILLISRDIDLLIDLSDKQLIFRLIYPIGKLICFQAFSPPTVGGRAHFLCLRSDICGR